MILLQNGKRRKIKTKWNDEGTKKQQNHSLEIRIRAFTVVSCIYAETVEVRVKEHVNNIRRIVLSKPSRRSYGTPQHTAATAHAQSPAHTHAHCTRSSNLNKYIYLNMNLIIIRKICQPYLIEIIDFGKYIYINKRKPFLVFCQAFSTCDLTISHSHTHIVNTFGQMKISKMMIKRFSTPIYGMACVCVCAPFTKEDD